MPFVKETIEMNREKFVKEAEQKVAGKAELCRKYGISRPTGDLWIARYHSGEGFSDKSKAPFHTANKTNKDMESLIIAMRNKEPAVGALKIKRMLENAGHTDVPCSSTINAILNRNNLITREASDAVKPHKRFEKARPNEMWQADFKGYYFMQNNARCYPLSIIDDFSRFCISADAKENEQLNSTVESFIKCFQLYGLPNILLCDNGNPWGASQSSGITRFEVWLMELGILTIHIRAKHPQTQGKVERFNGSFKDERLRFYTPVDLADADRQRQEYRDFYNNERPHHALGLDTPAMRYCESKRHYPGKIAEWEYGDDYELRNIKRTGYLTYGGRGFFLSEGLGEKTIAIKPSSVDGIMNLYFRQFKIGKLDMRENTVISRKIYLVDNDPRTNQEFRKS